MGTTENRRRQMVGQINSDPLSREELEALYGKGNIWNTNELSRDFTMHGFMAPLCVVTEKSSGRKGSVLFQHSPRFYFDWAPE